MRNSFAKEFSVDLFTDEIGINPLLNLLKELNIKARILVITEKKWDKLNSYRAKINDEIWVSGTLGMAALGLASLQGKLALNGDEKTACIRALQRPQARVELGLALRHIAHSAIDISDGLLADLGHILKLSKIGARLDWGAIPKLSADETVNTATLQEAVLGGGDDYELCFTAPESAHAQIIEIGKQLNIQLSCIGVTQHEHGLRVLDGDQALEIKKAGYDHFK